VFTFLFFIILIVNVSRLSRPHLSGATFSLLTTFPNKELTDDSMTIEKAGLANAAVLLRVK
jgi:UBX domain-containing protein 1